MKKTLLLLILIIPFQFFGQNYKLINAKTKKLFATLPDESFTYSLSIEKVQASGPDSLYYNFLNLNPSGFPSDTCHATGFESICVRQDRPVWAGPVIKSDNAGQYLFYNLKNDSLRFLFRPDADSTVVFFKDSTWVFSTLFEKTDTITILGKPDSARYFKIIHTDTEGNPVDSPLNGQEIIIGKDFGMVSFFVIDSFPEVLKPIRLVGDESHHAGFWKLTNEMAYNYQPDDEIQYFDASYYEPGSNPPWYNYKRYIKLTFLDRKDTPDSIKYTVKQTIFYVDSTGIETDTITIEYSRSEIIAEIPFEKFDGDNVKKKVFLGDYCGKQHWTYSTFFENENYFCVEDSCWVFMSYKPPDYKIEEYVEGIGLYNKEQWMIDPVDGYSLVTKIVYYNLGGEVCGKEVIAGIHSPAVPGKKIVLQPNPASLSVYILSPVAITRFSIFDITGAEISTSGSGGKEVMINVNDYPEGLYFIRLWLVNHQVIVKKLVITK